MTTGKIFEIKPFAVHDGPGIRTTVFFKGCPLKCVWCHNPEGMSIQPEIAVFGSKCVRCGECLFACHLHEIDENGIHTINRKDCKACCNCVKMCMPQALKLYGTCYTPDKLFKVVFDDFDFYQNSGGGITCSGGEPLMQPEFLTGFLSLCKEAGLHTAVDTSGYARWQDFEKILPLADIFLYDIKHMDNEEHKKLTGKDNLLILKNLRKLSENGAALEVRLPIIPGINDGKNNLRATVEFLKDLKTLTLVRPLQYHAFSVTKYDSVGKGHKMPSATGQEKATMQKAFNYITDSGLPVQ